MQKTKDAFMGKQKVEFLDWGRISYKEAWEKQTILHNQLKETKLANRKAEIKTPQTHYLIFCEHNPVYTLGKSGKIDHLLLNESQLESQGIEYFKINRGGDITYHGPGQIVAYPIFDLDEMFTDVHKYVRFLEEAVIKVLKEYGVNGIREDGYTGVWLPETDSRKKRKICAIGVHLSRWVTMHGLAFNINTDLNFFNNIIPCGIRDEDKEVTTLAIETGKWENYTEVKEKLKRSFQEVFDIELFDQRKKAIETP